MTLARTGPGEPILTEPDWVPSAPAWPGVLPRPRGRAWWWLAADAAGAAVAASLLLPIYAGLVATLAWLLVLALGGCYADTSPAGPRRLPWRPAQLALLLVLLVELVAVHLWPGHRDRLLWTLVACAATGVAARMIGTRGRSRGESAELGRVVVVGTSQGVSDALACLGGTENPSGVVATCLVGEEMAGTAGGSGPTAEQVVELVHQIGADTVVAVPCAELGPAAVRRLGWALESTSADLLVSPGLVGVAPDRAAPLVLGESTMLRVRRAALQGPSRVVKDAWERVAALVALVALSPVLLLLAITIRLDSRGPVVFRQERIGRGGARFTMLKLRTMTADAEARLADLVDANESDGVLFKVRADPRITRVGGFLRRFSLDELPQLWNVVRGEMSLIGPRPALHDEVLRYEDDVRRRMAVKPGLTGLWQVSGRSDLSWDESVALDLFYVDNWSLTMDASILLRTVGAVLRRDGAY